jgi:hypothetical protein
MDKTKKQQYIENFLTKRKLDYEYEKEPEIEEIKSLIGKSYERFEEKRIVFFFRYCTLQV